MGKNYYALLGVSPVASEAEIASKFRVLAFTYHPEKNKANMAQANYVFSQVCEAYEVLSNRKNNKEIFQVLNYFIFSLIERDL